MNKIFLGALGIMAMTNFSFVAYNTHMVGSAMQTTSASVHSVTSATILPPATIVVSKNHFILGKQYEVYLSTSIEDQNQYQDVINLLETANKNDTVVFHLFGNGGSVNTVVALQSSIRNTKAMTVAKVHGDVYSGHAYLAVSVKKLIVDPNVHFLIHRSSLYGNEDKACENQTGTDRKQDNHAKCVKFINILLEEDTERVKTTFKDILTQQQIAAVLAGDDVIVSGNSVQKAFNEAINKAIPKKDLLKHIDINKLIQKTIKLT